MKSDFNEYDDFENNGDNGNHEGEGPEFSHIGEDFGEFPEGWDEFLESIGNENVEKDLLSDIYMDEKEIEDLLGEMDRKKNVILQGGPGTGKTYTAKNLAALLVGSEDPERIRFTAFHKSFTYENFIGREEPGIFTEFCETAAKNPEDLYFFIIDEINRGDIANIFGEALSVLEKDRRGEQVLLQSGKSLSVPENLYLLGTMNTVDGPPITDPVVRRRFGFFDMKPGFDSENFKKHGKAVDSKIFDRLIEVITEINDDILGGLTMGKEYLIGHSYFSDDTYSKEKLYRTVRHDIYPMLEEYYARRPGRLRGYREKLFGLFKEA